MNLLLVSSIDDNSTLVQVPVGRQAITRINDDPVHHQAPMN